MSKKRDLVYTEYYEPHIRGKRFANNPVNNIQAATERMYQRVFMELCANRFKWTGLPDSVDERFLELELLYSAVAVFYKDDLTGKELVAKGAGSGPTNFNDNPTSYTVIGSNMQSKTLSILEAVPIYANYLRCPDLDIILLYSRKLANIDRTIEINVDNMRYSKVIMADENSRLSWTNINRQQDEGQGVVFVSNTLDMSAINVFDVGVPSDAVPNLLVAKSKLWNECMGLLGINNSNQEKKERLVAAEVGANDEQVEATRNIALNARLQACDKINKMFDGVNVSVEFITSNKTEDVALSAGSDD